MATLQLNGKTVATQVSSADPVLGAVSLTNATAGTGAIGQATAKAWVNLDGTGNVNIKESFNVSSITDLAVGAYRINLSITLSSVDYCVVASHDTPSGADADASPHHYENPTTTTFSVTTFADGAYIDADRVMAIVFGD